MKKTAFTLAEVLITLAIIGVVAAMTIPSVIVRTQQQEFKTGLKKALSALNSSIQLADVQDGVSPFDARNSEELAAILSRHMNVIKTDVTDMELPDYGSTNYGAAYALSAPSTMSIISFYTADGFRYDIPEGQGRCGRDGLMPGIGAMLIQTVYAWDAPDTPEYYSPCMIIVDVNGDKGPSTAGNYTDDFMYMGDKITDTFYIFITDTNAIVNPYHDAGMEALMDYKTRH